MTLFRKFYDTAAPETPSIASIMAKNGVLNSSETPVAQPVNLNTEKKEEHKQPDVNPPAATAKETPIAEKTPESPAPKEELKPEAPKKEEPPVKIPSWQEVLKTQQPDSILRELGFDEDTAKFLNGKKGLDKKLINFLTHWEQNGDVTRYLEEANTDYDKMSAENLHRLQLKRDYPKATDKQLDILFKKEVLEAHKLTEAFSDEEADEGRELLAVKAEKLRDKFKAEQENYLVPKAPEKVDDEKADLEQHKQYFESYKNTISGNQSLKGLLTKNTYTIGDGEDAFNLPLNNANESVDRLFNVIARQISIGEITDKELAQVNDEYIENQILIDQFAQNPKAFIKQIAEHYTTVGGRKIIAPIESAKKPTGDQPAKAEEGTLTPAAAAAKHGKLVSGGY